ncbi:glycosyltransferase family 2 protein [Kosakonia pseudosacchari]|nr:glycosyltransferase family 2 protein [Kosakonia pseudosacchari]
MLSLIIPVYLNAGSLPELLHSISNIDNALEEELEVVFVVDGSPDNSYQILKKSLADKQFKSQLILLSRNFGSFIATRTGLQLSTGERFAVMAADLQEPPELVLEMNKKLLTEDLDVVVGVRESRADPLLSKLSSKIFWWVYKKYVIPEMPTGGVDMFACNKQFRDVLLTLEERHSSLISQLFWIGFNRGVVSYKRRKRQHGKSAWTLRKKITYLMDSVFSFTDLPIRLLVRTGAIGTILAGLYGIFVLISRILGVITLPGYSMTIFTILFFSSLNLLGIGIIGSYAWRTYENTKNRPISIPMKIDHFRGKHVR